MSISRASSLIVAAGLLSALGIGQTQEVRPETMAMRVRRAIDRGVDYLKSAQRGGHWEDAGLVIGRYQGGVSCLAMLALLESGVNPNEDVIVKGLAYLRTLEPKEIGRAHV